jgi:hypothetical protein
MHAYRPWQFVTVVAIDLDVDLRQVPHVAGKLIADKLAVIVTEARLTGTERLTKLTIGVKLRFSIITKSVMNLRERALFPASSPVNWFALGCRLSECGFG